MESQIIKLDGLEINREYIEAAKNDIRQRVENGELDPLKVMSAIKLYEKIFNGDDKKDNGLNHLMRPFVINELSKDSRKDYYGFKVELAEVGSRYDFSNCNDPQIIELYEQMDGLKNKIKERENFLKAIKNHETIVDENSGELIKIFPPVKKSTS